ncbi:MAG: isochorismatase family protein [Candidatus Moraniibacteriota bacterium]
MKKTIKHKTAFVLVDMQTDVGSKKAKRAIIPHQVAILKDCIRLSIPVVIVEFEGRGATHSELTDAISGYQHGHIIQKCGWSALRETTLAKILTDFRVDTFLLGGIEACACLYDTASDARPQGFRVVVCGDLTAGYERRYAGSNRRDLWQTLGVHYLENRGAAHRFLEAS